MLGKREELRSRTVVEVASEKRARSNGGTGSAAAAATRTASVVGQREELAVRTVPKRQARRDHSNEGISAVLWFISNLGYFLPDGLGAFLHG